MRRHPAPPLGWSHLGTSRPGRVSGPASVWLRAVPTAASPDRNTGMDRKTTKSNLTTGMLLGAGSAAVFAMTFIFAMLYIAG